MIRVCAITERRADYSKLRPVLREIEKDPEFRLELIVTGQHLLPQLGLTSSLIENDGFDIASKIPIFSRNERDNGADMVKALGRTLIKVADVLEKLSPDLMLVGFDLGSHLAAAMAAAHMNIPVAHIEGGEVSGSIDESIRHAITRFAHVHFTSNRSAARRLVRMGENPKLVFNVGCPSLDNLLNMDHILPEELHRRFEINAAEPLVLVIQHPVTTEADDSTGQVMATLKAIRKTGFQAIFIYPNVDAGGRRIIQVLEESRIKSYPNLPFEVYASLLRISSVLVGNSSSGIIEASSLKLPVVNIGTRQQCRLQAENVLNTGYQSDDIYDAVMKAVHDKEFRKKVGRCRNPYGDGKASSRIVKILKSVDFHDPSVIQKRNAY